MPDVVVAVPTYRRPLGLERCLMSLAALTDVGAFKVIVADNDPVAGQGLALCRRLTEAGFPLEITAIAVHERGVAAVRNALVDEALQDEQVRFIAMIDDDEWAEPGWLAALLRTATALEADVVGGPVRPVYESEVPRFILEMRSGYADIVAPRLIDMLFGTNNILFSATRFRDAVSPWFDAEFGLTGGEDRDLLLRFKMSGARFAWAPDAVVAEEMPTSRCSKRWMIQRSYRVGNTDTLVNVKNRPSGFGVGKEFARAFGALLLAAGRYVALVWSEEGRFHALMAGARAWGKLAALRGSHYEEYRVVHGK